MKGGGGIPRRECRRVMEGLEVEHSGGMGTLQMDVEGYWIDPI